VFSQHAELLDNRLDDLSRKRMMQKIRNRISAQESRDRRKNYIEKLEAENNVIKNENTTLKEHIKQLKEENFALLEKVDQMSTTRECDSESNPSNDNPKPVREETHISRQN